MKLTNPTISDPTPFEINTIDLFPQYQSQFNSDALEVFKTKANGIVHQYNECNHKYGHRLHDVVELLALLGIKSAYDNPVTFTRKISLVKNFGFTCHPNEVDKAAQKIIKVVNDMAASKWINASMYNLGMIKLGKLDQAEPDRVCVFSYVAVKSEHEQDVDTVYSWLNFKEGAVPSELK